MAVDASGNVFVADFYNSAVKEIVAVNGVVSSTSQVNPLGSGFSDPYGVAVDGSGNVFVADNANSAVKEIVAVNGVVSSTSQVNPVGSGFNRPISVAVDASGNVFVADNGNSAVKEIELAAANFSTVNVGSTSPTMLVPFTFDTLGTPGGWSVLPTVPSPLSPDFTEVTGSTTCSTSAIYNQGDTCSVAVQFTPRYAGLRMGAVQLKDAGGNVIATAHLRGLGVGPQIAFPSNTTVNPVGGGFNNPSWRGGGRQRQRLRRRLRQ